jgi:hypothetical protein
VVLVSAADHNTPHRPCCPCSGSDRLTEHTITQLRKENEHSGCYDADRDMKVR